MLAEFKYGLEPKETFAKYLGDQAKPRRFVLLAALTTPITDRGAREYYHLKKTVFPFVYWNYMLQGQWFGPKGVVKPEFV
jgi:hypothetical protein